MKGIAVVLIGLATLVLSTPALATLDYQHQVALCAAVDSRQPSASVLERLGEEFFEQKDVRTVTDYPVEPRSVFTKGEDNRIFLVSWWHGLSPERSYRFSCQWIDPDGRPYNTASASLQTPENLDESVFFTYTAFLNVPMDMKEGLWTVKVFLNEELVEARELTVSSE